MTDIKKGLGILFEVVGILIAIAGGVLAYVASQSGWTGPMNYNLIILGGGILGIGIIILVVGIVLRNLARRKKLDSMSETDLAKMFECPVSGTKGAIQMIKLVKDQILIKQSCPPNKVRLLRIPLRLKDQCIPYFRDVVFRCFKCGQKAAVEFVKTSGPWTLLTLSCPTHGYKQPTHKIWSSIYSDMTKEVDAK